MIGIIGALTEELEALQSDLTDRSVESEGGYRLYRGTLSGKRVLLARSGVGKVNAAVLSLLMIQRGARTLIFTGVAGGVDPILGIGDLVVSRDAVQHDVDATAFAYRLGQVPGSPEVWEADPALRLLAIEAASTLEGVRVLEGRVASGDQFIASAEKAAWLREAFGAACVEMEGAAVAQVCAKWDIPWIVIRSISDSADRSAALDFESFSRESAQRAKRVVWGMLERL